MRLTDWLAIVTLTLGAGTLAGCGDRAADDAAISAETRTDAGGSLAGKSDSGVVQGEPVDLDDRKDSGDDVAEKREDNREDATESGVEDAIDDAADIADDAAEDASKAGKEAGKAVGDAAKDVGEAAKDAVD